MNKYHHGLTFIAALLIASLTAGMACARQTDSPPISQHGSEVVEKVKDSINETADVVKEKAGEIGETINQNPAAHDLSQSILNPIYQAAEWAGQYPAFYWSAFALMTAGVVSFLLQLVLSKFFLLFKMHINIKEIIMDVVGLLISVAGLVFTTQAAAENSESFVQSPAAVMSALAVGGFMGLVFYVWGQRQEFQAARGRVDVAKPA